MYDEPSSVNQYPIYCPVPSQLFHFLIQSLFFITILQYATQPSPNIPLWHQYWCLLWQVTSLNFPQLHNQAKKYSQPSRVRTPSWPGRRFSRIWLPLINIPAPANQSLWMQLYNTSNNLKSINTKILRKFDIYDTYILPSLNTALSPFLSNPSVTIALPW